jgi:hypothetical protein
VPKYQIYIQASTQGTVWSLDSQFLATLEITAPTNVAPPANFAPNFDTPPTNV